MSARPVLVGTTRSVWMKCWITDVCAANSMKVATQRLFSPVKSTRNCFVIKSFYTSIHDSGRPLGLFTGQ